MPCNKRQVRLSQHVAQCRPVSEPRRWVPSTSLPRGPCTGCPVNLGSCPGAIQRLAGGTMERVYFFGVNPGGCAGRASRRISARCRRAPPRSAHRSVKAGDLNSLFKIEESPGAAPVPMRLGGEIELRQIATVRPPRCRGRLCRLGTCGSGRFGNDGQGRSSFGLHLAQTFFQGCNPVPHPAHGVDLFPGVRRHPLIARSP